MNRVEALKKKMDQGKLLKGFFLTMADSAVSEIGGYAGYDYVWIDAEHAPLDARRFCGISWQPREADARLLSGYRAAIRLR